MGRIKGTHFRSIQFFLKLFMENVTAQKTFNRTPDIHYPASRIINSWSLTSSSKFQTNHLIPKYFSMKCRVFKLHHCPEVPEKPNAPAPCCQTVTEASLEPRSSHWRLSGLSSRTLLPLQHLPPVLTEPWPAIMLAQKTRSTLVGNQEILNFNLSFAVFLNLNCPNY